LENYARDGTLLSVKGTAVYPVGYTNGIGSGLFFTKEIKLDTNGVETSEWTKTYHDLADRPVEVQYPDGAGAYQEFNAKGQLVRAVDPDGVTTLYSYNARAEVSYTAIDLDRDGQFGWAADDRITQTTNDVTSSHGATVRRSRRYVWADPGQNIPRLIETTEQAADSLQVWRTNYGQMSHSQTVYGTNGLRTVTLTAPDGSSRVRVYSYGRQVSETWADASMNPTGAQIYGYDEHSRVQTVMDARTGTITNAYDAADQLVSSSTAASGSLASQTTAYEFDSRGRIQRVVLTDGAAVTNQYYLTGQIKQRAGVRVYPQLYAYDAQGRLKTLTTWTNFTTGAGAATTTWNYEGQRGWMTNKVYTAGVTGPGYTYTPAGRAQTRGWARGITATYSNTAAGELRSIVYSDGTANVTNAYDRLGRLATVTQGSNVCVYSYNDAGQVTSDANGAGLLSGLMVTNLYDGLLRRTNLEVRVSGVP